MSKRNTEKTEKADGSAMPSLNPQDVLPFPPTPSASIAGRTMQESVYKRRVEPRRLPADAPNILIVLIDDAGPGLPTTFGGEVHTRTMDRISKDGITYNRFHTTAMCSPTTPHANGPTTGNLRLECWIKHSMKPKPKVGPLWI